MIVKIHKGADPYTRIVNSAIKDPSLSFRALGVLTYLLSKPPNWTMQVWDLCSRQKEGRDAIRTAMNELKDAGYAKLIFIPGQGSEWHICGISGGLETGILEPEILEPENPPLNKKDIIRKDLITPIVPNGETDLLGQLTESNQILKNGASIPTVLNNQQFVEAWQEYKDYRKENKRKFGDFGPIAQKRHLLKLSERPQDAVRLLNFCMDNQYRGVDFSWLDNSRQLIRNAQPKKRLNDDL